MSIIVRGSHCPLVSQGLRMIRNYFTTQSYKTQSCNLQLYYTYFDKQFTSIATWNSANLPPPLLYHRFVRKTRWWRRWEDRYLHVPFSVPLPLPHSIWGFPFFSFIHLFLHLSFIFISVIPVPSCLLLPRGSTGLGTGCLLPAPRSREVQVPVKWFCRFIVSYTLLPRFSPRVCSLRGSGSEGEFLP